MFIFNGRKYQLDAVGSAVSLFANTAGAVYPYNSTISALSVIGNGDNNASYPYFYGLKAVRTIFCPTAPTQVRAYIADAHPNITPAIRQVGDSLTVDPAGQNYQWFEGGNPVNVLTRTFRPEQNGSYTVRLLADSCLTPISAEFQYVRTSNSFVSKAPQGTIKIYPQPAQNSVRLESPVWSHALIAFEISDLSGKQVFVTQQQADANGVLELSINLPKGIYFAKSTLQGSVQTVKMLVD